MHVCMLSKFPPIEGGISSRTYWLACGLVEQGVSVSIVTNAECVESDYRIGYCNLDHLSSSGAFSIYNLSRDIPWHIPFSQDYPSRLLNLTLKVITEHNADVIDSGYLVPFGIVGWLASRLTSVPHIIRHGASDIWKFLNNVEYSEVLQRTLADAAVVITDTSNAEVLQEVGASIQIKEDYVPSNDFLVGRRETHSVPVFAYIGKINYHWERRKLGEIAFAFRELARDSFRLQFIAQGKGKQAFIEHIGSEAAQCIEFVDFHAPWDMPEVLKNIDYLICLSEDDPIAASSYLRQEAELAGVKIIDNRMVDDRGSIRSAIGRLLQKSPEQSIDSNPRRDSNYEEWVATNMKLYKEIANEQQ